MRVALYLRVSCDDGARTVENQRLQLMEFCARMSWKVVATFEDTKSGKNLDRPGFKAMMAAASRREFDVLISGTCRGCRAPVHWMYSPFYNS